MKKFLPAYRIETPKLFKVLVFNYPFSNGDAHFKNFAILETPMRDHRLSPAYDLLNTRIHVDDSNFALEEGLLPKRMAQTTIATQFKILAEQVEMKPKQFDQIMTGMMDHSEEVIGLTQSSFLEEATKKNYIQDYQYRLKQLQKLKL